MLPVVESVDVSQRDDVHKLKPGAVGLAGVLFLTVTGSAPISAMLFNTPIAVGFGNGIGAPAGFMFATVVLTDLQRRLRRDGAEGDDAPGASTASSRHGLGRELGMASGFSMVAAYSVFEVSLVGGFAYFAQLKAESYGVHIAWYWYGFAMIALIAVLVVLRRQAVGSDPGRGADLRGDRADRLRPRDLHGSDSNVSAAAINPLNAFKSLPAGPLRWNRTRGRRRGDRHLLRVLVVGRVRDGAQLRRGVEESEEERAARAVHLRDRPRHLLHADVVGRRSVATAISRSRSTSRRTTAPTSSSCRRCTTPARSSRACSAG